MRVTSKGALPPPFHCLSSPKALVCHLRVKDFPGQAGIALRQGGNERQVWRWIQVKVSAGLESVQQDGCVQCCQRRAVGLTKDASRRAGRQASLHHCLQGSPSLQQRLTAAANLPCQRFCHGLLSNNRQLIILIRIKIKSAQCTPSTNKQQWRALEEHRVSPA